MGRTLAHVLDVLHDRRPDLERMGVRHVWVFGSVARGEEAAGSDVDLMIEVDDSKVRRLFAYGGIQQSLEHWIGRPVDLARCDRLRPHVAATAVQDGIRAF